MTPTRTLRSLRLVMQIDYLPSTITAIQCALTELSLYRSFGELQDTNLLTFDMNPAVRTVDPSERNPRSISFDPRIEQAHCLYHITEQI
jgi:hypothetical protein